MNRRRFLIAGLSVFFAAGLTTGLAARADAGPAEIFPTSGTVQFKFQGAMRDGTPDVWTTRLGPSKKGKNLVQYEPHHDVVNFFSKFGLRVDAAGITIQGESMDGDDEAKETLAVAFPLTAKAEHTVPGLFSCKYTVVGKEKVKVPAGTFDTWRIKLKDNVNPEGAVWIAPGTGIVKIQIPGGRVDVLVEAKKIGG